MKYVLETLKKRQVEEKLPVIKMEIDYELMTLADALKEKDEELVEKTKEKLESLRLEWLSIDQKFKQ
jgi:actin-related protein